MLGIKQQAYMCGANALSGWEEYQKVLYFKKEVQESEPFLPFDFNLRRNRGGFLWQIIMGKVYIRWLENKGKDVFSEKKEWVVSIENIFQQEFAFN